MGTEQDKPRVYYHNDGKWIEFSGDFREMLIDAFAPGDNEAGVYDTCKKEACEENTADMVNHPPHYQGKIEAIDYIADKLSFMEYVGYLRGNIIKYLTRMMEKGAPSEDAKKAAWYLQRLIEHLEGVDEQ